MSTRAEVQVTLTTEAKLAALDAYQRKVQSVTSMVGGLKTVLGGLGAAVAVGSVANGFQAASQHLNTLSTDIARSAGRVGVGAEAYQVFGHVLKAAGGDAADLTTALSTLRNAIGESLRNGDSSFAKAFGELGLKAADLSRLRPEVQLERVAKALAGIEDPARRASLAQDILGKGASNLKPVLDRLAVDGFGGLRDEVAATAGIMSGDMARALDDLETRIASAGNRTALALSPLILKLQEGKAEAAEFAARLADVGMRTGKGVVDGVGTVAREATSGWGAVQTASTAALFGAIYHKEIASAVTGAWAAATAKLATMPVWAAVGMKIGGIAAGLIAVALASDEIADRIIAKDDVQETLRAAPTERFKTFNAQYSKVDSPEMLERFQVEAARRAREAAMRSWNEQDAILKSNLQLAARQYWGLFNDAKNHGAQLVANNRAIAAANAQRTDAERLALATAWQDQRAYEWIEKQGAAMEKQNTEARRRADLSKLDADQRRIVLEMEKAGLIERQKTFQGTPYEAEKNRIETESKILAIDEEIAAAQKEIAAAAKKTADDKEREAEAAERAAKELRQQQLNEYEGYVDKSVRDMRAQDARNQADYSLTDEEKRRLRRAALEAEQSHLTGAAGELRRAGGEGNIDGARRMERRSAEIGAEIEANRAGTPETALDGMTAGLTQLQNQWGTLAQQMQRATADIGQGISQGIGGALNQVLGTTEYWSQSLGNIAGPIMGSITQSISRMFSEWIVARGAAAIKNIAFSQKEGAADAIAKAPGALFGSISSFGVAAAVGVAAFIAATALAGGFRTGGYTGGNDASAPAGVVHQGEWVAPKWMVDDPRYSEMISTLEAIRSGQAGFSLGGFVKYGGMPKWFWGKQVSGFMDRYNFVDGSKLYPSAIGQDATFDASSQQWIQNPDQSVAVPSALTPSAAFAGNQGGGDDDGSDPAVKPMRVAIFDESSKDAYDQFVNDPRYETAVVRFSRKNAKRLWGGQTG